MKQKNSVMQGFGPHVTIDGYKCDPEKLGQMHLVYKCLNELPDYIGMTKMMPPFVVPWKDKWATKENGCSGFVMIAESHISIHTFVEENFFTADIYSCKGFDTEKAIDFLKKAFDIKEMEINIVQRGTKYCRVQKTTSTKLKMK